MDANSLRDIIYQEGNFEEWIDKETGYLCRILRPYNDGHLCGYVNVPDTHPMYNKDYSSSFYDGPFYGIEVHGGLTYSGDMDVKGNWWIGFDCVHSGDLSPRDVLVYGFRSYHIDDVYQTKEYVKSEVTNLAKQLKNIELGGAPDY